ncbi:MAG: enzyme of heme biosynthesis [Alistipes sp.]|jgi:tetratricopeptide (TPR) repeat protein|nr:enzyme of heme biosynthesis [Alistipes sp.]
MKKLTKIALAAVLVMTAGSVAVAQNFREDPRYGATPEERETNVGKLNFLSDAMNAKNYNEAATYIKDLMTDAPKANQNVYIWGATVYSNKAARATSVAEKRIYTDSVMLIYDRRIENYGPVTSAGASIRQSKARAYLGLNAMDREGIRRFYKDAVDAAGADVKPDLVLEYFQQLVNDFKGVQISPEELLTSYEALSPYMTNASQEEKDSFTGLFATSGAADCGVLEELYTKELAASPGDVEVLKKAWSLMSMAACDSEFYLSVGEQYYAAEPSSDVAIRLAMTFEKTGQFDKAIPYLNEQIESETDPVAKSNLYVRVAASELGQNRYSAAAQAARQAISLNADNGLAHMLLGNAYLGGGAACSGFNRQTVSWLAYDEFSRARAALEGDTTGILDQVNSLMGSCRGNFPSTEDVFMYGLQPGGSHSVSCGWISGSTTVRAR